MRTYRVRAVIFSCLAFSILAASVAQAGDTFGTMCINCDVGVHESCARETALILGLDSADQIWVLDPNNVTFSAYVVDGVPPGGEIRETSKISGTVDLLPVQLPANDVQMIEETLIWIRDLVLPNGGRPNISCSYSSVRSPRPSDRDRILSRDPSTTLVMMRIEVPPGEAASAYDLIGNQARSVAVADHVTSKDPAPDSPGASPIADPLPAHRINAGVALVLEFSDGSLGRWSRDSMRERWVPDFSTFEDSDGNPIPLTAEDIQGRQFEFSGDPPGEGNLENFLERMRRFGLGAPDPFPPTCPTTCTPIPDGIRCTVNCD